MSSSPVRVGFKPTFSSTNPSAAAPRSPATRKKAADEKSPGTSTLWLAIRVGGSIRVVRPSVTMLTPALSSMRSL